MSRRFYAHELRNLRNFIPIDFLIEKILMIPSKFREDYFRFLCPLCSGFNTATNPKTNLARCFRCQRNFNTIDMVMITEKVTFVESVKFLKKCQNTPCQKEGISKFVNARLHTSSGHMKSRDDSPHSCPTAQITIQKQQPPYKSHPLQDSCNEPVPISKILQDAGFTEHRQDAQESIQNPHLKTDRHKAQQQNPIIQRITELEQQMEYLSKQLQHIEAILK